MKLTSRQQISRNTAWLAFFGMILFGWVGMFAMSNQIGLNLFGQGRFVDFLALCLTPAGPANIVPYFTVYGMWALMMAAMMGPTFVPTARTYEDLINSGAGSRGGLIGLIVGYLLVWLGFAAIFASAQLTMQSQGWLDVLGASASGWLTFSLLLIAGVYQFTATKDACLTKCRSPMTFFLGYWRGGALGGARMGASLGVYCLGCCWAMMALGFIGGVMNLVWMGIATLIMTIEKLPDVGRWMTRPLGGAFLLASLLVGANNVAIF